MEVDCNLKKLDQLFHIVPLCLRKKKLMVLIGHFTVVCLVTWPLSGSEAGGDLVLIQTLLPFTCRSFCCHAN